MALGGSALIGGVLLVAFGAAPGHAAAGRKRRRAQGPPRERAHLAVGAP